MDTILKYLDELPLIAKAGGFFVLWLVVWALARKIVFAALRKWSARLNFHWEGRFFHIFSIPLWLIILASGVELLNSFKEIPENVREINKTLALVFLALALIIFLIRFLNFLVFTSSKRYQGLASSAGIVNTVIKISVVVLGSLILLDTLGLSITPFLASLGIGSLAVGLALQDTLANFFAGFYLTLEGSFKIGDFIKIQDGMEGVVEKTSWRATYLRTLAGSLLVVPNSKMASGILTNFDLLERETPVVIPLRVAFEADLEKVERVTLEAAREALKETAGAVAAFEPVLRYSQFSDSGISFNVFLRSRHFNDQFFLIHSFIKKILERYQKEGIEMPCPRFFKAPPA